MSAFNANPRKTELCVFSYNSRGFGPLKQEYCRQLISSSVVGDKIPVLCNQENFMLRNNSYKINQPLLNFQIFFKTFLTSFPWLCLGISMRLTSHTVKTYKNILVSLRLTISFGAIALLNMSLMQVFSILLITALTMIQSIT